MNKASKWAVTCREQEIFVGVMSPLYLLSASRGTLTKDLSKLASWLPGLTSKADTTAWLPVQYLSTPHPTPPQHSAPLSPALTLHSHSPAEQPPATYSLHFLLFLCPFFPVFIFASFPRSLFLFFLLPFLPSSLSPFHPFSFLPFLYSTFSILYTSFFLITLLSTTPLYFFLL